MVSVALRRMVPGWRVQRMRVYQNRMQKVNGINMYIRKLERCKASRLSFIRPQYAAYSIVLNEQLHTVLYCATSLSQLRLHIA